MDINKLRDEILPVLRKYSVKKASLFGSVVRGEEKEGSDIDLLVEFEGRKSLLDLAGLKIELEEKLKREVDVLTYNSLHPLIKEKVLREKVDILLGSLSSKSPIKLKKQQYDSVFLSFFSSKV